MRYNDLSGEESGRLWREVKVKVTIEQAIIGYDSLQAMKNIKSL